MIKKIKGSLFAKIFAITFLLTSICCVLTYTVISWLVPKTYSTTLDASLENTVSSFIAELQTMSPLESGTLFDEFLLNNNGVLLQLSDDDGNAIELPSQGVKEFPRFLDGGIATENTDPGGRSQRCRSGSDSDVGSVVLWQRRKNESSIHTGGKLEMEDASGRVP